VYLISGGHAYDIAALKSAYGVTAEAPELLSINGTI
jgi:hypothetical protein